MCIASYANAVRVENWMGLVGGRRAWDFPVPVAPTIAITGCRRLEHAVDICLSAVLYMHNAGCVGYLK